MCIERGLPATLHKPDLNSPAHLAILATRTDYKAAQREWGRRMTPGQDCHGTPVDHGRGRDCPNDWDASRPRPVKLYRDSSIVADVCRERGIEATQIRFHADDPFVVIRVVADTKTYRAAQYEWLQRMIANAKRTVRPVEEATLFV